MPALRPVEQIIPPTEPGGDWIVAGRRYREVSHQDFGNGSSETRVELVEDTEEPA